MGWVIILGLAYLFREAIGAGLGVLLTCAVLLAVSFWPAVVLWFGVRAGVRKVRTWKR